MSAPSVMEVLNQLALEAHLFRTAKSTNDADFDQQGANAIAAVAELVAAARDGAAVLQSKAGPLEQETVRRLYAALARVGGAA